MAKTRAQSQQKVTYNIVDSSKGKTDSRNFRMFDAIVKGELFRLRWLYNSFYNNVTGENSQTGARLSKLLLATLNGHTSIVYFLLNQRKDYLDLHDWNQDGQNPLIEAIKKGYVDIVKIMANHSYFFTRSFKDKNGNTPLHYVGNITDQKTRKALAFVLIEAGIDIDQKNNQNQKPKHYAEFAQIQREIANRYPNKLAEALLFKPKSTKISDHWKAFLSIGSISGIIALFSPMAALASFVLAAGYLYGCLSYKQDIQDRSTLIQRQQLEANFAYHASHGTLSAVRLKQFMDKGIDINRLTTTYESPLTLAAKSGNVTELRLLINNMAQVKPSAVYAAISHHHLEATKFLISQFKDVDLGNKNGMTPLIEAIVHNDIPIIKYLLEKGAHTGQNEFISKIMRLIEPADTSSTKQRSFLSRLGFSFGRLFGSTPKETPPKSYTILDYAKVVESKEIIKLLENANKKTSTTQPSKNVVHAFQEKRKTSSNKTVSSTRTNRSITERRTKRMTLP